MDSTVADSSKIVAGKISSTKGDAFPASFKLILYQNNAQVAETGSPFCTYSSALLTFQCTLPSDEGYEIWYEYTSDCGGTINGKLAAVTAEKTVPIKCNGKCVADFGNVVGKNIVSFRFQRSPGATVEDIGTVGYPYYDNKSVVFEDRIIGRTHVGTLSRIVVEYNDSTSETFVIDYSRDYTISIEFLENVESAARLCTDYATYLKQSMISVTVDGESCAPTVSGVTFPSADTISLTVENCFSSKKQFT